MLGISVIVTAYNRTQYFEHALKSLADQSFSKDNFEVILITNFECKVDVFDLKVKHIVMDGNIGHYLVRGIRESEGEIICFLDDDDLFHKDKLNVINKLFKNSHAIYFKNETLK
jgi:glycosyltransferase involved in cell wall biosynthesis